LGTLRSPFDFDQGRPIRLRPGQAVEALLFHGNETIIHLLLDSSVLIDALRLRAGRREWLADLVRRGDTLATSALNLAEV
jgi:hypothetical protein